MTTADVGILLVWVGPWRPWIELMLHSFTYNRGFALHIVSPEKPPAMATGNIYYHRLDCQDLDQRLSWLLGTGYHLERGYKLCDFRPAFRDLFPEYLGSYRYWGWCNEDIIWGDLGKFFKPAILDSYDIIASCRSCITGQLALVRHSPRTDSLYSLIPGWREKLLDQSSSYALDEQPLNNVALGLEASGDLRVLRRQFQTHDVNSEEWNRWADELEMAETGQPHGQFKHGSTVWRDGHVYNAASGGEFGFFHFGHWKHTWILPPIGLPPSEISEWHFSKSGIDFHPTANLSEYGRKYIRTFQSGCRSAQIRARTRRARRSTQDFVRRVASSFRGRIK